jgi:hypothetical protein
VRGDFLKCISETKQLVLKKMTSEIDKDKEEELKEAKELFKEGLRKIFKATKKVTGKIIEGFREGYAEDVTKKEDSDK